MILDNTDNADVFFTQHNSRLAQIRNPINYISALLIYLPQSSGGSILIITKNRITNSRLTGRVDRIIKIEEIKKMMLIIYFLHNYRIINLTKMTGKN